MATKKKGYVPFEISTDKFADTGVSLSDESSREALIAITKSRQRRGQIEKERLAKRENAKRIGKTKSTSTGKKKDSRGKGTGGASSGSIASPLTETDRTEEERTVISDDGLFEVTIAVVTQLKLDDANGTEVIMNLTPPTE